MSRPLPSGSIFSIRMVFAHSTHEMSVVRGLWSSFIGGATCDMIKSYRQAGRIVGSVVDIETASSKARYSKGEALSDPAIREWSPVAVTFPAASAKGVRLGASP